jgi:SHS2 domain-containing protein
VFELIPHTADVRVRVAAPELEELFRDAMGGMYAVMHGHPGEERVERVITVRDSADSTTLLVDFLNEVLGRGHIARELFTEARFTRLDATSAEAHCTGTAGAFFDVDVKAVTYHEANVHRDAQGLWTTMLVFDL